MELFTLNTTLTHQEPETISIQQLYKKKFTNRVKTSIISSLNLSTLNNKLTKIEVTDSRLLYIHQKRLERLSINSNATLLEPNSNTTLLEPNSNTTLLEPNSNATLLEPNSNATLFESNYNETLLKYNPRYIIPLYSNDNEYNLNDSNDIPKYEVKLLSFTRDEKLRHEPIFYAPTSPGYFYIVENSTYKQKSKKL